MKYKVLIVDDEKINILLTRKILENFPQIKIIGEAMSVEEFIFLANSTRPDILLLDIHLGKTSVFEVLDQLEHAPKIIFVSSAEQHALDAFRVNAVDFVLKPVISKNLEHALTKAIDWIESERKKANQVVSVVTECELNFIAVSSHDKCEIFKVNEVLYCKADGRCTIFYLNDQRKICSYKNLMEYDFLCEKSPYFIKVSRSCIVNFEHVKKVIKKVGVYCELINGIKISVSRRRIPDLNKFINSFGWD